MRLINISEKSLLAFPIVDGLKREGFIVDKSSKISKGLWMAKTTPYDLAILQIPSFPVLLDTCRKLVKECPNTFIIVVSSHSLEQRLELFESGADEILVPPFSFRELVLKLRILLRREKNPQGCNPVLKIDDLEIDVNNFVVKRGGKELRLRRREFDLLHFLFRNQGKVLVKLAILEAVWDCNANIFTNTVEVHILNLRRKVDNGVPLNRRLIHTVYGRGYKFGLPSSFSEELSATEAISSR